MAVKGIGVPRRTTSWTLVLSMLVKLSLLIVILLSLGILSIPSRKDSSKAHDLNSLHSVGGDEESSKDRVQSPAVPISVPVRVAHELLQAGHRYLDVRTSDEFSSGHVVGAVNVPFMLRHGPGMTKNPRFVEEVLAHFRKDDEIIVGCQSGKRSLVASSELLLAGFTGITDMAGGYASWLQNEPSSHRVIADSL